MIKYLFYSRTEIGKGGETEGFSSKLRRALRFISSGAAEQEQNCTAIFIARTESRKSWPWAHIFTIYLAKHLNALTIFQVPCYLLREMI